MKSHLKIKDRETHCRYCGQAFDLKRYVRTFDHFYPLRIDRATLNRAWNRFVVCKACNNDKAHRMPNDFIIHLLKKLKQNSNLNTPYFTRASKTVVNMILIQQEIEPYFIGRDIL